MATVAGIGIGLFILAFVWALCFFLCLAFSRAQGAVANAGIGFVLLAIILTVILWFFPRGEPSAEERYTVFDSLYIARMTIISFCGVMMAVGGVLMVVFHVFEPQKAVVLKRIR
jgi:hypothetical protein